MLEVIEYIAWEISQISSEIDTWYFGSMSISLFDFYLGLAVVSLFIGIIFNSGVLSVNNIKLNPVDKRKNNKRKKNIYHGKHEGGRK